MSSKLALKFESVSKSYKICEQNGESEFWALRDVSFDVKKGDVIGIIGRNGAGKSTLLKILSRITEPSHGVIKIKGTLASLLEVGTGFHPELTGRENIFLNGAILGMTQQEVRNRFDNIVAFAEIKKFIDTPVKHYSSGMYVRLAFAVAAHLEPDVLVVDEVLAVGDTLFQKKCLGRLRGIAGSERTVLFVSHSLLAVRALCTRVIVLDHGKLLFDGDTESGLLHYTKLLREKSDLSQVSSNDRTVRCHGDTRFRVVQVKGIDSLQNETWTAMTSTRFTIRIDYVTSEAIPSLGFVILIRSSLSSEVVTTFRAEVSADPVPAGINGSFEIRIPNLMLRPGEYSLHLWFGDRYFEKPYDVLDDNVSLPLLSITSDERQIGEMQGYFSLPMQCVNTNESHQSLLLHRAIQS